MTANAVTTTTTTAVTRDATAPDPAPARPPESPMSDLAAAEAQWHDWILDACAALDVDPRAVDVTGIHALTKDIAHGFSRPMAPVGSYILGVAVGLRAARGEQVDPTALTAAIRSTLPTGD